MGRLVGALLRVVALTFGTLAVLFAGLPAHASEGSLAVGARSTVTSSAPYLMPVEDYAGYQPQTRCSQKPKPGVLLLAAAITARGGGYGPISRTCTGSSTSEHKESRAFDWLLDATDPTDRALADALLDELLAPDDTGATHALARRMGIMYVIWNDRMYASYNGFEQRAYLSSGCRSKRRCSPTLRHRDHMHISLTREAAKGLTSWYTVQPPLAD